MTTRAGVSENVFRELFPTVEDCYRTAHEDGLERLARTIAQATARHEAWLDRVRAGLVALLAFFDDEPSWARILMLETPLDAALAVACRQRLHTLVAGLLEGGGGLSEGSRDAQASGSWTLSATLSGDLVVGGVLSVVRTSMLEGDAGKLVELAPSLMAFIVAPYLGRAAAQAELEGKPSSLDSASMGEWTSPRAQAISRTVELPIRATHRTTLVLRAIAQAPYSNNREVAQAAGLTDEGQASKLLARLERRGVIENVGAGAARGEPNAWLLTVAGRRALELLAQTPASRARTSGTPSGGVV